MLIEFSHSQRLQNTQIFEIEQAPNLNQRIEAEQIRHIYNQTPVFVPAVFIGSLFTIILLWPATTPLIAISWCVAIWIIYSGFWFLCWRYKQIQPDDFAMKAWAKPYVILAWLAIATWGITGVLFFHADSIFYQSLLIIAIVIGAAAITATSTAYSPTFYPLVLMLLPVIVRLLMEDGVIYKILALGLCTIGVMMFFLHRNSHAFFATSLRQRFMNETLAAQLAIQKDIAEQSSIAKSKFLAIASHDLRQPLQALNLFLGELQLQGISTNDRQELMQNMQDSISGMNDLFDGLMDVCRFEVGVVSSQLQNFYMNELLESLREEYSVRAHEKALTFRCAHCNVRINSDPLLLRRIIRNLLENSLRYTHKGGILLGCRRKENYIVLQVLDTGMGIAEKNLNQIFNEFQQLGNPTGDNTKGIGLGLSVVKQLAHVLDYELYVESIVNKGTMFSLKIPLLNQ